MGNITDDDLIDAFVTTNPEDAPIIKAIGVGGGGGNAVKNMYESNIHDVSYVICNTDKKALDGSPIPRKIQMGDGLGAGNKPKVGREKAESSLDDIKRMLSDGTKMVFITAGMGGGTGTGAAPIIAKTAKEMDILTIAIVTIPFLWEGKQKINQALLGIDELRKNVDALLIVNNERLLKVFPDLTVFGGFEYADDILTEATRSIVNIINMTGTINLDFNDVCTILKDSGVAIMSTGKAKGDARILNAIKDALKSPLLNEKDITKAKRILFNIASSGDKQKGIKNYEMEEIHKFMDNMENDYECKWGIYRDDTLEDEIRITVLASGFNSIDGDGSSQQEIEDRIEKYYKGLTGKDGKQNYNVFIFEPDDLDDEDIICSVEKSPTFNREQGALNRIKHHETFVTDEKIEEQAEPAEDFSGPINF